MAEECAAPLLPHNEEDNAFHKRMEHFPKLTFEQIAKFKEAKVEVNGQDQKFLGQVKGIDITSRIAMISSAETHKLCGQAKFFVDLRGEGWVLSLFSALKAEGDYVRCAVVVNSNGQLQARSWSIEQDDESPVYKVEATVEQEWMQLFVDAKASEDKMKKCLEVLQTFDVSRSQDLADIDEKDFDEIVLTASLGLRATLWKIYDGIPRPSRDYTEPLPVTSTSNGDFRHQRYVRISDKGGGYCQHNAEQPAVQAAERHLPRPPQEPQELKVHMSFSSSDGMLFGTVTQAISEAGMKPTAAHTAQISGWFDIWRRKLFEASGVVIVFSNNYRQRFLEGPLVKEARAIDEKMREHPSFMVYILDPDTEHRGGQRHNPSDVQVNLLQRSPVMGDVEGWKNFVSKITGDATFGAE